MTRTKATLATIGTILGVPLLCIGASILLQQGWFWYGVGGVLGLIVLIIAAMGVAQLWLWFRRDCEPAESPSHSAEGQPK